MKFERNHIMLSPDILVSAIVLLLTLFLLIGFEMLLTTLRKL